MASETIDSVYADHEFRMTPMIAEPNSRAKPDPSRPIVEGRCPFIYASKEFGIQLGVRKTYREANDFRSITIGYEPFASIAKGYFETKASWPSQDDIFEIVSEPDFPRFKVLDVQPDGMERLELRLEIIKVNP